MIYDISDIQIEKLLIAAARAGEALARLDERISRSPMKHGFIERQDFTDAISSMWVDGELVHMEDLVLHDAHMDVRAPTHEMTAAHRIPRNDGGAPNLAVKAADLFQCRRLGPHRPRPFQITRQSHTCSR